MLGLAGFDFVGGIVVDDAIFVEPGEGVNHVLAHSQGQVVACVECLHELAHMLITLRGILAVDFHKVRFHTVGDALGGSLPVLDGNVERCGEHGVEPGLALAVVELDVALPGQSHRNDDNGPYQHQEHDDVMSDGVVHSRVMCKELGIVS